MSQAAESKRLSLPVLNEDPRGWEAKVVTTWLRFHNRLERRMAEALVDAPEGELLRQVEYDLRDAAHDLAAQAHQTGLEGRKKGGTSAPA